MQKSVMLSLNNFVAANVPHTLMGNGNVALDKITVPIQRLCHHMLLDTYNLVPTKANPLFQFFKTLISASPDLEFIANSLGSHKEAKNAESMKLGKAFCRWFLAEHFGFTYFGHMDQLLGRPPVAQYGNIRVIRAQPGDTPDYLCSDGQNNLFLAEAKGRQTGSISFNNADFAGWRQQFQRINVLNSQNQARRIKGYVVATRFRLATQTNAVSKVFCEDPVSPGADDLTGDEIPGLNRTIIHNHYSGVFELLGLLLHATALREGYILPREEPVVVGVWRGLIPPIAQYRWIGGFLPFGEGNAATCDLWWPMFSFGMPWDREELLRMIRHPFFGWSPNLGVGRKTFFGLEWQLFKSLLDHTRNVDSREEIEPLQFREQLLPQQVSLLRDGTMIAPASFMQIEDVIVL